MHTVPASSCSLPTAFPAVGGTNERRASKEDRVPRERHRLTAVAGFCRHARKLPELMGGIGGGGVSAATHPVRGRRQQLYGLYTRATEKKGDHALLDRQSIKRRHLIKYAHLPAPTTSSGSSVSTGRLRATNVGRGRRRAGRRGRNSKAP